MSLPLMLKFCGRRCCCVRIGDAEEEIRAVVAGQRLRAESGAGGRIVERGGIAGVGENRLLGRIRQSVQNLLPIPPAEFDLVIAPVPRVVLLAAEDLGVLGARHDAVQADSLVKGVVDVGRAGLIERIRRAELAGDILLRRRPGCRLYCQLMSDVLKMFSTKRVGPKVCVQEAMAVCDSSR